MKNPLLTIVSSIEEIYITNTLLCISFDETATPDLIDFLVRNALVSIISPENEVKYSNPLLVIDKLQSIEKLCLKLTTTVSFGEKKQVSQFKKPVETGDNIQFRGRGITLGEFTIGQKTN